MPQIQESDTSYSMKLHICFLIYTFSCRVLWVQSFHSWKTNLLRNKITIHRSTKAQPQRDDEEKQIDAELLSISFFSFLHQASIPFGDIVDGIFLSKLDAGSLGAMGVARSSHKAVNKLCNSPLSKTTISMIASAAGAQNRGEEDKSKSGFS
jgi:Na+-driven multidrug efflux pump